MHAGLTAYRSLLVPQLLEHASVQSASAQVVSVHGDQVHRSSFHHLHRRARRLGSALAAIGVRPGDRIASIAGNDHRHVELYFAATGLGAALHTIDPRLETVAMREAIRAAGDRFLCFDARDAAQSERFVALREHVLGAISMTATDMFPGNRDVPDYEKLLAEHEHEREHDPVLIDEDAVASLAAAPGQPQRLIASTHRMTALHAVAACADDVIAIGPRDSVLMAVPLFLPGAWSLACAVAIGGANLVLPGAGTGTSQLFELMRDEQVTLALGTPDVWTTLLDFLDATQLDPAQVLALRGAIACGDVLHPSTQARLAHTFGPDVVSTWSLPPDASGASS